MRVHDRFHGSRPKGTDQLVLQVCVANEETHGLHVSAGEVGTEACPLETAPEVAFLSGVAEPRHPDVGPWGTEPFEKRPMFLEPPIEMIETPSAWRSRPRRSASTSSAR